MFDNALIATDLGESAEDMAKCKEGLANLGVRRVFLAVCLRLHEIRGMRDDTETILHPELSRRQDILEQLGYEVEVKLIVGEPCIEVNRWAEDTACQLIVIGSRLHNLAGEIFLGGVAAELLHNCRKPLLILRQPQREQECGPRCPLRAWERILFPSDFSDNSEHAFLALERLVEEGLKSIELMHVTEPHPDDKDNNGDRTAELRELAENRLERMGSVLKDKGADDVRINISRGLPKKKILARSRKGDISLILMGTCGRGFIGEVFLGSVSHAIARCAPVPVMLLPTL